MFMFQKPVLILGFTLIALGAVLLTLSLMV
jgi:hypothetical protein